MIRILYIKKLTEITFKTHEMHTIFVKKNSNHLIGILDNYNNNNIYYTRI